MSSIWNQHWLFIVLFLAFGLFTVIFNSLTVRRFDQYRRAKEYPRVSVLVPARNEEQSIWACVTSLLSQEYPDFEVIVLDDHSTDNTRLLLNSLTGAESRLRVLNGLPLPPGWFGKHWACHQLAQAATGDLLLFTDADTCHAPYMLRDSVSALLTENADLVTAFPREEAVGWGERLLVPFIGFGIFTFLPMRLIQKLRWSTLSLTIGQFMLFRRAAYEEVGGFEAVRDEVLDDVRLGQCIIEHGFEWRLMDGTRHFSCRMYRGFWEAVEGFSKNVFAIFEYRILPFVFTFLVVGMAFLEPPLALLARRLGWPQPPFPLLYAQSAVVISFLVWSFAFRRFKFPLYLVPFYPLILTLFIMVAVRSLVQTVTGTAQWKGRTLDRVATKWL
jgi:chlorobactene glucosyltransferase